MKKLLMIFLALLLVGCGRTPAGEPLTDRDIPADTESAAVGETTVPMFWAPALAAAEPGSFSWTQALTIWGEGEPGVRTENFVNTAREPATDPEQAIELAKRECRISWDSTAVAWDPMAKIWRVTFYTEGTLGGCLDVYLDSDGITRLVVAGE